MAKTPTEISVLPEEGTKASLGYGGGLACNVWRHHGVWEIRPGFGQLAQHDCTMALMPADKETAHGHQAILGTHAFRTAQGHDQIVTVCRTRAGSSNLDLGPNHWGDFCSVLVYDVTTDARWDEVLSSTTAGGNVTTTPLPFRLGTFETNRNTDTQTWVTTDDTPVFFTEYQGNLLFTSSKIGVWAYIPIDPADGRRRKQVDGISDIHAAKAFSETATVIPVVPTDGLFVDNYAYLGTDAFPVPSAMAVLDNHVCYADGRDVYFADQGRPGSILRLNILAVPTQGKITALGEASGNLVICTDNLETWVYRPNVGAVMTAGELVRRSGSVGCLSQNAMMRVEGALVWADENSVWLSSGLTEPQDIAVALAPLFDRGLPLPLSNYYQNTGQVTLANAQPKPRLRWSKDRVSLTYEAHNDLLCISLPDQNAALVLQNKRWLVWQFESVVQGVQTTVRTWANINNPHLRALQGNLYIVCGPEVYTPADQAATGGTVATNENAPTGSVILLQWGRGGGLDRSCETVEDRRRLAGWHQEEIAPVADGAYILWGEPYLLPTGTILERVSTGTPVGAVLYPVCIRPGDTDLAPTGVNLIIRFDNTEWRPILANEGAADIAIQFPPERHRSRFGWGPTVAASGSVPVPGVAEAQIYNSGTGLVDVTGSELRIRFDGATGSAIQTWSHANQLNLNQQALSPLFWIPFRRLNAVSTNSTMNVGLDAITVQIRPSGGAFEAAGFLWWHHADPRDLHAPLTATSTEQAVDWCIKSPTVNIGGPEQVRMRGVFLRVFNKGRATNPLFTWPRGLLNYVSSSNDREWATQIADFNSNNPGDYNPVANADPLDERLLDPPSAEASYNNVATWSDTTTTTAGNLLIADTPVDEIGISDSVRGDTASAMLFGHVRGRAETLGIETAQAPLRPAGKRRRT